MIITRRQSLHTMGLAAVAVALMRPEAIATPMVAHGGLIRIAFNENPAGPSPAAREAIREGAGIGNRYVMDELQQLEHMIASKEGVSPDQVVLGTGSGEVLAMAGAVFGLNGGQIVASDNTFDALPRYATAVGARIVSVPLTATFHHDLSAMASKVTSGTALVYVCNPNNPTATLLESAALHGFCSDVSSRAPVLVDEAYLDYEPDLSDSAVDFLRRGKNVIVTRTFSKIHGLAGMRIGYGLAPKPIASRLKELRMTWMNHLSVRAALASLGDPDFVARSRRRNTEARETFCGALHSAGIQFVPSHTNFVYVYAGPKNRDLPRTLLEKNILIERNGRHLDGDWARISIGTLSEMQLTATALRQVYRF